MNLFSSSLDQNPSVAAGDQRGDISQCARQPQSARIGEVPRLPRRMKLVFVRAQPLKVVERLAMRIQERPEAIPERRNGRPLEAGQRSHAEREAAVSLLLAPAHKVD